MQENNDFKIGSLLRAKTKEELLETIFNESMSMRHYQSDLSLLNKFMEEEEERLKYHKGISYTVFAEPTIEYNSKDNRGVIPFGYEGLLLLENKKFYQGKIPHCKVLYQEHTAWLPRNNFTLL